MLIQIGNLDITGEYCAEGAEFPLSVSIMGEPPAYSQNDFERDLKDLLKLISRLVPSPRLMFNGGQDGPYVLPDWFKTTCKSLGIKIEIQGREIQGHYWHMNLHPTNDLLTDNDIKKIVSSGTIGMGIWERNGVIDPQITDFKNRVQIGDIVAVVNGKKPIALVEVIGDWYEFDDPGSIIWFCLRRAVKILCIDDNYIANLDEFPSRTKTLKISTDKNSETYKYIDDWYKHCKK
ncbi:hypothetical protein [Methylococcus geothermalis]|uniref:Uncharacterized protein n=1 Tax=Methylococcus geothermalis TaxID=2681310 RepID=A0A858Q5B7_9GAMM|nr:hypothetical protein [Methylococcus geothermalis]QJD29028.1 hypothetical protein GNH96_02945 [Methylococcus geothermalis]